MSNDQMSLLSPTRRLRDFFIIVMLSQCLSIRAPGEDRRDDFAGIASGIANAFNEWDAAKASRLIEKLKSPFRNEILGVVTEIDKSKGKMEKEFGEYVGCRFVRSRNELPFSSRHYYVLIFKKNIMSMLINGYWVNGEWTLLGFHVRRETAHLYPDVGLFNISAKRAPEGVPDGVAGGVMDAFFEGDFSRLLKERALNPESAVKMAEDAFASVASNKALGKVMESRLIRVHSAGSLLRTYAYVLLGETGHLGVDVELLQITPGEWRVRDIAVHNFSIE